MKSRREFLKIWGVICLAIMLMIYFGLKKYSQKNFSKEKVAEIIAGKSKFRDTTTNLCTYQILGEPKVGKNYIKVNFWCNDNSKARSTLALVAFEDKSLKGILKEYARIIGFDEKILKEKNWYCTVNDKEINQKNENDQIEQAATIDCFERKGLRKHD